MGICCWINWRGSCRSEMSCSIASLFSATTRITISVRLVPKSNPCRGREWETRFCHKPTCRRPCSSRLLPPSLRSPSPFPPVRPLARSRTCLRRTVPPPFNSSAQPVVTPSPRPISPSPSCTPPPPLTRELKIKPCFSVLELNYSVVKVDSQLNLEPKEVE